MFILTTIFLIKNKDIDIIVYRFMSKNKSINYDENTNLNKIENNNLLNKINVTKKEYSKYKGTRYINEIFFERTKKNGDKKRIISLVIRSVIIILFSFICYILVKNNTKGFIDLFPIILFITLYILFHSEDFIKKCFMNMDASLLRYSYYRKTDCIYESLKIRLIKYIKLEIIPITLYLMMSVFLSIVLKLEFVDILINLIIAIFGIEFFGESGIFLYYIFQPYNKELKLKGPIIIFIRTFLYFLISSLISKLNLDYLKFGLLVINILLNILIYLGLKYRTLG